MHTARQILLLFLVILAPLELHGFNQVVIWGHKLHSHTHSYIHHAFYKAFHHLGYETYWFDDKDDVSDFDFADSLFLTEGQVDQNIPLRKDCNYLLHNCDSKKYKEVVPEANRLKVQVYTNDVLNVPSAVKLAPFIYFDQKGQCVYMPWATDLLPYEIEALQHMQLPTPDKKVYWIGTIGGGFFGNYEQILPFKLACEENGVAFVHAACSNLEIDKSIDLIRRSYMAPSIVGRWQQEKGYIPCRIFKNVSYGQLGITNSQAVYELFEEKIVYNQDTYQLFLEAERKLQSCTKDEINESIDFVKSKHTYLNRVQLLISALNAIKCEEPTEIIIP